MDGKENEKLLKCCCALDFCDLVMIDFFFDFFKAQRSTCSGEQLFGKVQKLPKVWFLVVHKKGAQFQLQR